MMKRDKSCRSFPLGFNFGLPFVQTQINSILGCHIEFDSYFLTVAIACGALINMNVHKFVSCLNIILFMKIFLGNTAFPKSFFTEN